MSCFMVVVCLIRVLLYTCALVRSCPGRHFADATLFINIASVLHVLDITPPLDEDGKEIKIEMTMTDGFSS